jgi:hypothetical protein
VKESCDVHIEIQIHGTNLKGQDKRRKIGLVHATFLQFYITSSYRRNTHVHKLLSVSTDNHDFNPLSIILLFG